MPKNALLLLCLFSISGLIWSAHGDREAGLTKVGTINNKNAPSTTQFGTSIMNMITNSIGRLVEMIMPLLQPLADSFKTLLGDVLQYLASSDSTGIALSDTSNVVDFLTNNSQNGSTLAAMLSSAFMMPFKVVFGAVRSLPLDPVYNQTLKMLGPIGVLLQNPVVQVALNSSKIVVDTAAAGAWNFTKVSVLPKMDQMITNMKESNTLPDNVMSYLTELQTLYHIFKVLGMA